MSDKVMIDVQGTETQRWADRQTNGLRDTDIDKGTNRQTGRFTVVLIITKTEFHLNSISDYEPINTS